MSSGKVSESEWRPMEFTDAEENHGLRSGGSTRAKDWPLTRDEKKDQVISLFCEDLEASEILLQSNGDALEALRQELYSMTNGSSAPRTPSSDEPSNTEQQASQEADRLRDVIEVAASVLLKALQSDPRRAKTSEDCERRARSAGSLRMSSDLGDSPLKPARRSSLHQSRPGTPKRLSFSKPLQFSDSEPESGKDCDSWSCRQDVDGRRKQRAKRTSTCEPEPEHVDVNSTPLSCTKDLREPRCAPEGVQQLHGGTIPFVVVQTEEDNDKTDAQSGEEKSWWTAVMPWFQSSDLAPIQTETADVGSAALETEGCGLERWPNACGRHSTLMQPCARIEAGMQPGNMTELWVPASVAKLGLNVATNDPMPEQVVVNSVVEGAWADTQGILVGDTIIAIAGVRVARTPLNDFVRRLKERPLKIIAERPLENTC